MPYDEERLAYGRMKADQIKDTGAEIGHRPLPQLPGPDHEGPDQGTSIGQLQKPCTSGNCWPGLHRALERGGDRKGHGLRDAQFERDGVVLEEMEEEE